MAEAIKQEMTKPNHVEGYSTEYGESFSVRDFVPSMDNVPNDSEVSVVETI